METSEKKLTMGGAQTLYNDLRKRAASADENLAPYYDATQTYAVGDRVMYKDILYECNTAIATAEAWTAAHWTQRSVADALEESIDKASNVVIVSNTQPQGEPNNKIWIKNSAEEEYTIPTYEEFEQVSSAIDDVIVTNIIYESDSKVVTGTGKYVFENILTIDNPTPGTVYTFSVDSVTGATNFDIGYIYSYDGNDTRTNHAMSTSTKVVSYTVLPTDAKILFTLYPSISGAVTATYTNVRIYTGTAPKKHINQDYMDGLDLDGGNISDGTIGQKKLSFAEIVLPENLFDYTSSEMCKRSTWYYSTSIGSVVSPVSNSNTTPYVAIKIPLYSGIEKVTFGIYPNVLTRNVFWVGAVDADMKLINYQTVSTQPPITYTIPSDAKYLLVSYSLDASNFDAYIPTIMAVSGETITGYSEYHDPYYLLENCRTETAQGDSSVRFMLPETYDAVVGDTIQIFYKGIINATKPELYDVKVQCAQGSAYTRYFELTPTTAGNVSAVFSLYDRSHNLVDTKSVVFNIRAKATNPGTQKNVLCVGDSLTTGGVWPVELHRRLAETGGTPAGDGLTNINFIGTRVVSGVCFEGYGGWSFNSYNTANVSTNAKIITCTHDKTEALDQHSIYKDGNNDTWKLETIESGTIKIIAVSSEGRNFPSTGTLTWVSGGTNHSSIIYTASENAPGNPFWNATANKVDFATYATEQGVSSIDYVLVLLGWNSAALSEEAYKEQAQTFITNVHASFPNAKIVLMGLEIPARDGLGANYGANGTYSDYYGLMQYVFNLDAWYLDIADDNSNVYAVNLSGQFDTEYNMPTGTRQVNTRNTEMITYQSNGVHPATPGYYQIADAFYRWITGVIN